MFNRHQAVGEREICSYMLQMASLLFAPPWSRSSCILSDYYHIFVFVQLNQIDEDLGVFLHQLLLHQLLLHQLLLHQDLFLVLYLVVLRDGGVAVELQLVVSGINMGYWEYTDTRTLLMIFLARMKTKNCGVHLHLHFTDIRTFSIFVKTTILLIIMAGRYARCTTFIKIQIFPNFSCCM